MIRKKTNSSGLTEIRHEALRWMENNKGLEVQERSYSSPRISSELPDCSMPLTFDQYNYCSLGCLYCFAYFFKMNNPSMRGKSLPLKSVNIDNMISAMQGNPKTKRDRTLYKHFYSKEFLLHWGGLGDPFCNFESKNADGFKLLEALGEMNYPCLMSFKGSALLTNKKYVKLFEKYADQGNFAFQASIITNSDEMSKQVEVGVPLTTKRLECLRILGDMGYWTILRLRPIIMGVSDIGLDELLGRALECKISGISAEWYAMDSRASGDAKKRYKWLAELMGVRDLHEYFSTLSPSERGGYMRLNRKVKEPIAKKLWEFCDKNNLVCGISDPDFKELNTSGSCCGMPDKFPKNKKLENWTRNQLTYKLKEARLKYHKTGTAPILHFGDVYGDESYLDSNDAIVAGGSPEQVCRTSAENKVLTYRYILHKHWNNLRSPSNPRNYLHGKLMPIATDGNGDLVYKYEPMPYESRWADDGIKLVR